MRTVKREKHARARGRQFSCAFSCFTHFIVRSLRNSLTKKLKSTVFGPLAIHTGAPFDTPGFPRELNFELHCVTRYKSFEDDNTLFVCMPEGVKCAARKLSGRALKAGERLLGMFYLTSSNNN